MDVVVALVTNRAEVLQELALSDEEDFGQLARRRIHQTLKVLSSTANAMKIHISLHCNDQYRLAG